jgi:hypothetical protein
MRRLALLAFLSLFLFGRSSISHPLRQEDGGEEDDGYEQTTADPEGSGDGEVSDPAPERYQEDPGEDAYATPTPDTEQEEEEE